MLLARLKVAAVATLVVGAGACLAWLFGWSEHLRYRTLRVVGHEHVSEAAVRHLADLTEGEPLVLLDLDRAVVQVEAHPWVRRAEARRVFPDGVVVQVQEREVAALLLLDGLYLVDTEGTPFRRADASWLSQPLLTGIPKNLADSQPALARRMIRDGLDLLAAAERGGRLRRGDISEVRFDAGTGFTLALRNGGEVLLGFNGVDSISRLDVLALAGVDITLPHRVDLGLPSSAVVTPL